jgi:hypothetical protein
MRPEFEGALRLLQATAGPDVSGENLGFVFSTSDPTLGSPRLRLRKIDPASKIWRSAHEGAAAMVRGAFMQCETSCLIRDGPSPGPLEALEMLAVISYVAHLVEQSDKLRAQ